jgi:hypothetical protein
MSLDPHVSDTFEILSVFFTNVFYNELYLSAFSQTQQASATSITDLYKKKLIMYYGQMNNDVNKWFNNFIVRIKLEYDKHTKHIFITNAECIDNMCTAFVPTDFIKSIIPNKKFSIVFNCIRSVVSNMIAEIGQQHLTLIIDERKDKDSIITIKESFISQFIAEREKMFGKFIDSHTRETRTTVSAETVKRIRDESEKTKKENNILISKIRSMSLDETNNKREIEKLTNAINVLNSKNEKLCSYVKEYRSKVANLEDNENELEYLHNEISNKKTEIESLEMELYSVKQELANKSRVVNNDRTAEIESLELQLRTVKKELENKVQNTSISKPVESIEYIERPSNNKFLTEKPMINIKSDNNKSAFNKDVYNKDRVENLNKRFNLDIDDDEDEEPIHQTILSNSQLQKNMSINTQQHRELKHSEKPMKFTERLDDNSESNSNNDSSDNSDNISFTNKNTRMNNNIKTSGKQTLSESSDNLDGSEDFDM